VIRASAGVTPGRSTPAKYRKVVPDKSTATTTKPPRIFFRFILHLLFVHEIVPATCRARLCSQYVSAHACQSACASALRTPLMGVGTVPCTFFSLVLRGPRGTAARGAPGGRGARLDRLWTAIQSVRRESPDRCPMAAPSPMKRWHPVKLKCTSSRWVVKGKSRKRSVPMAGQRHAGLAPSRRTDLADERFTLGRSQRRHPRSPAISACRATPKSGAKTWRVAPGCPEGDREGPNRIPQACPRVTNRRINRPTVRINGCWDVLPGRRFDPFCVGVVWIGSSPCLSSPEHVATTGYGSGRFLGLRFVDVRSPVQ